MTFKCLCFAATPPKTDDCFSFNLATLKSYQKRHSPCCIYDLFNSNCCVLTQIWVFWCCRLEKRLCLIFRLVRIWCCLLQENDFNIQCSPLKSLFIKIEGWTRAIPAKRVSRCCFLFTWPESSFHINVWESLNSVWWKPNGTFVRASGDLRYKFGSGLLDFGAGVTIWPCHPLPLLFTEPTEDCLCFVLRPSGCSSTQPWLIQAGLRGEQPGWVTPPGIWCLAAIQPAELRWSWGWN